MADKKELTNKELEKAAGGVPIGQKPSERPGRPEEQSTDNSDKPFDQVQGGAPTNLESGGVAPIGGKPSSRPGRPDGDAGDGGDGKGFGQHPNA